MTDIVMTMDEQKRAFACALLKRPDKPFEAALSVIPDTGVALQAATLWVNDPFVKSVQIELLEQFGPDKFVPTDIDQLNEIWKIATGEGINVEIKLKAHELYAKIKQGHFRKPDVIGNQTNVLNQGVMQVVNNGTDEEWEKGCIEQQARLVQDAT
jgi:hypothetical protein